MNRDFAEMLSALSEAGAEFLVGRADFVTNKRASGRDKDLLDLKLLGE